MSGASHSQIVRTIPVLIVACLFALPAQAKYGGGSGTAQDPYQIATAADLITLGETPADYDKHFLLTGDIDLDPHLPGRKVFDKAVIAPDTGTTEWTFHVTPFAGVFDGNGHTISHLTIKGSSLLGLFGQLESGAQVKNLGVVDVNITGSSYYIGDVGGLAGVNYGRVTNCYSTGAVTGSGWDAGGLLGSNSGTVTQCYSTGAVSGTFGVGGLVGSNGGHLSDVRYYGTVSQCYSTGKVSGGEYVGGLVGENSGSVSQCYSTGAVSGTEGSVGGLVGFNGGPVTYCYSTGAVSGDWDVGGLVGSNGGHLFLDLWYYGTVSRCYSTGKVRGSGGVGGLVGYGLHSILHCVWDIDTSGLPGSVGAVGLTTAEMMDPYMLGLNGFANDPNWVLNAGHDYPRLAWEGKPGSIVPEPQIDWLAGGGTLGNPYRVDTAAQLVMLGRASILWDRHVILGADINLDPKLPNGEVFAHAVIPGFLGVFDGNGHTLSHLTIRGTQNLGLFGQLESGAEVKNLGVVDVNVTGSGNCVGGLAGWNYGAATQCYSTGTVSGGNRVGGLVGHIEKGTVTQCYSTGAVSGSSAVGGLVGDIGIYNARDVGGGTVTQCYSTGAVSGTGDYVGGLVGGSDGGVTECSSTGAVRGNVCVGGLMGLNEGTVIQCYSTGAVRGKDFVGGLVGNHGECGSASECYSTGAVSGTGSYVGGLMGVDDGGDVPCSFWDRQTSGQTTSDAGTGKTTAQMHDPNTFRAAGWDFVGPADGPNDIWAMPEGGGYPILWWQLSPWPSLPRFSGGTGEPDDPYRISTARDLNSIGYNPRLMKCHFKLTANLDLTGLPFYPIGSGDYPYPYGGVFDGNGHTVSQLTIKGDTYGGLFGVLGSGAEVKDLGVVDVNITAGFYYVGGLASRSNGSVTRCYSTGAVSGGQSYVGGLVGENCGAVTQCYSTGKVRGNEGVGGLVGENVGTVTQCYSAGAVSGTYSVVGGLVGFSYGTVTDCYSTAAVSGKSSVGGLVGTGSANEVTCCFWNVQTSGQITSAGGTGKTTAEMQAAKTFLDAGWDFVGEAKNGTADIWWILEGKDYPRLWWEAAKN